MATYNRFSRQRAGLLRICLAATALVWPANSTSAARVDAREGNIYYIGANGHARQITMAGTDSDPSLSPDGRQVVFVRKTSSPAGFAEPTDLHPMQTEIRIADVAGTGGSHLVFGRPVVLHNAEYATFSEPRLAPGNRYVYFLIHYSVVEFGLVRLNLASGKASMISGALDWYVVDAGRYSGDLVVQKRKTYPEGSNALYWLISPNGKKLGYVGESRKEVEEFLSNPKRRAKASP